MSTYQEELLIGFAAWIAVILDRIDRDDEEPLPDVLRPVHTTAKAREREFKDFGRSRAVSWIDTAIASFSWSSAHKLDAREAVNSD